MPPREFWGEFSPLLCFMVGLAGSVLANVEIREMQPVIGMLIRIDRE